jgi:hypothetical protein
VKGVRSFKARVDEISGIVVIRKKSDCVFHAGYALVTAFVCDF